MSPAAATATRRQRAKPTTTGTRTPACAACARGCSGASALEQPAWALTDMHAAHPGADADRTTRPILEETLIHGRSAASIDEALKLNLVAHVSQGASASSTPRPTTSARPCWAGGTSSTSRRSCAASIVHLTAAEIAEGLLPVGALSQVDLDGLLAARATSRRSSTLAATWELPQAAAMRDGLRRVPAERASSRTSSWRSTASTPTGRPSGLRGAGTNYAMARRDSRHAGRHPQSGDGVSRGPGEPRRRAVGGLLPAAAAWTSSSSRTRGSRRCPTWTRYSTGCGALLRAAARRGGAALPRRPCRSQSFERALEDYFTRKVIALGSTDPLGVGIPIALPVEQAERSHQPAHHREGQVAIGMPAERTRRELILV